MGVRIIGDKRSIVGGVQRPTRRISIADATGKPIVFAAVGSEHETDGDDSESQPDVDGSAGFVDPASAASTGGNGDSPFGYTKSGRRRNKPVGSSTRSTTRNTSKTTDSISAMLYTIHSVAGSLLKMPMLHITRSGSDELAQAILDVTELYDVPLLSEKGMAWANLAAVAAKVYVFSPAPKSESRSNGPQDTAKQPIPMPSFMSNGSGKPN